ncbi:MAG: DUF4282 domain-containing protein [Vibrio sp.]|uniref:DUF4282 domain-containing protein n=1 Tax=Vibrio TaxID=662 RepID=UPI001ECC9742|nr:DUF4282 domain-containing protein [Vibrio sp.]
MKSIFTFKSMVAPKLIVGLYWLVLVSSFIFGILVMVDGRPPESIFYGVAYMVGGAIFIRFLCEMYLVIFKINDNLQILVDSKKNRKKS